MTAPGQKLKQNVPSQTQAPPSAPRQNDRPLTTQEKQEKATYLKNLIERRIAKMQNDKQKEARNKLQSLMEKVKNSTTRDQLEKEVFTALQEWRFDHSGDFAIKPEGKYFKEFRRICKQSLGFPWLKRTVDFGNDKVRNNAWGFIKKRLKKICPADANDQQFDGYVNKVIQEFALHLRKGARNLNDVDQKELGKVIGSINGRKMPLTEFNTFEAANSGLGERLKASNVPQLVAQANKGVNSLRLPKAYANKYSAVHSQMKREAGKLQEEIKKLRPDQMATLLERTNLLLNQVNQIFQCANLRERIVKRLNGVEQSKVLEVKGALDKIVFSEKSGNLKTELDQLTKLDNKAKDLETKHKTAKTAAEKAKAKDDAMKAMTPAEKLIDRWRTKYPWVSRLLKNPIVMGIAALFFGVTSRTLKLWGYNYSDKGQKTIDRFRAVGAFFGKKVQSVRDRVAKYLGRWRKSPEMKKIQSTHKISDNNWKELYEGEQTLKSVVDGRRMPEKFRKELLKAYNDQKQKFDDAGINYQQVKVKDVLFYAYKKWPYTPAAPNPMTAPTTTTPRLTARAKRPSTPPTSPTT